MLPAMHISKRQTKLTVVWEVLPNPDPEAVHKAFAILFRRRASVNDIPEDPHRHAENTPRLTNPTDLVTFTR